MGITEFHLIVTGDKIKAFCHVNDDESVVQVNGLDCATKFTDEYTRELSHFLYKIRREFPDSKFRVVRITSAILNEPYSNVWDKHLDTVEIDD